MPEIMLRRFIVLVSAILLAAFNATAQETDLCQAAQEGNVPKLEELLKLHPQAVNGYDPDGRTPLLAAVIAGRKEAAAFLISKGARLDYPPI